MLFLSVEDWIHSPLEEKSIQSIISNLYKGKCMNHENNIVALDLYEKKILILL